MAIAFQSSTTSALPWAAQLRQAQTNRPATLDRFLIGSLLLSVEVDDGTLKTTKTTRRRKGNVGFPETKCGNLTFYESAWTIRC
jgi:hypothetical protein